MRKTYQKIIVFNLIGLFILFMVAQVAYASMSTTPIDMVAISLDDQNDPAIANALDTLKIQNSEVKVIRFGTLEYLWTISFRPTVNYVAVGHGDAQSGVVINGNVMSWNGFANIANNYHPLGKIHFLTCGSSQVSDLITNTEKVGFTFSSQIDSKLGALAISVISNVFLKRSVDAYNAFDTFEAHMLEILQNPEVSIYLGDWGTNEKFVFLGHLIIVIISTLIVGGVIAEQYVPITLAECVWNDLIVIAELLHNALIIGAAIEGGSHLYHFFVELGDVHFWEELRDNMSAVDWIIIGVSLAALIAFIIGTFGTGTAAQVAVLIIHWAILGVLTTLDILDCDDFPHQTDESACGGGGGGGGYTLI